jgi:hypothetical protein
MQMYSGVYSGVTVMLNSNGNSVGIVLESDDHSIGESRLWRTPKWSNGPRQRCNTITVTI